MGIVTKNKALRNMNTIKNPYIHSLILIATSWLSGYASNVVRTYKIKIVFPKLL